MKRVTIIALLCSFLFGNTSFAQRPPGKPGSGQPADRAKVSGARRQGSMPPIPALLNKHIDRVYWDDAPFEQIVDWLRKQSTRHGKINVIAQWRALAAVGVDAQSEVSLELENVSVADVLEEVLDQLSGADPLLYTVRKNVLKVSTRSAIRRKMYTLTYDIGAVLAQARASRMPSGIAIGQQTRLGRATANQGGTGGGFETAEVGTTRLGEVGDEGDNDDRADADEIIEQFTNWIQTTVEPKTWQINGGNGTLFVFNDMLTVRNSADVHAHLGGTFYLIR